MRERTAQNLINLGTATLGVACVVVSALVPATAAVLGPLGGTLVGMAMRQPSEILRPTKKKPGPDLTPTPAPVSPPPPPRGG